MHHDIRRRHWIRGNFLLIDLHFPIDVTQPIAPIDDALWPTHSMILRERGIFPSPASVAQFAPLLVDGIMSDSDEAMTSYLQLFRISFENATKHQWEQRKNQIISTFCKLFHSTKYICI